MTEEDEKIDDEAAAAEWASMVDDGESSAEVEAGQPLEDDAGWGDAGMDEPAEEEGRVLNQDEIDLLLGFDSAGDDADNDKGIEAILGKALMAYEKLPMMEIVFDRMVRVMSSSFRGFTSENIDVNIDSMTSLRFEDYLNSIPLPALLSVFRATEWENFGLVTVDSSLIYSMVDILFGGRRSSKPIRVEGRPYTTIEQDIVKKMTDIVLSDMSTAFDPLSPVTFIHDRLENNPRFATITRPNNAALLVRLRVEMEERGGIIEILLPHATLEPIRDLLTQIFMGETFGHDSVWEKHLSREVKKTEIVLDAILSEKTMKMNEISNFHVGGTILLDCDISSGVMLKCNNIALGSGKLGRIGDKIAISINDKLTTKKEGQA